MRNDRINLEVVDPPETPVFDDDGDGDEGWGPDEIHIFIGNNIQKLILRVVIVLFALVWLVRIAG